jgi:hypothetical protein
MPTIIATRRYLSVLVVVILVNCGLNSFDHALGDDSHRYEAVFENGERVTGNSLRTWGKPEHTPHLDGHNLGDVNRGLRWLIDRQLEPYQHSADRPYLEFYGGDFLVGDVVDALAGIDTSTRRIPSQLVVQTSGAWAFPSKPDITTVEVDASFVRRVVFRPGFAGELAPSTLRLRDGRVVSFRRLQWESGAVRVLIEGVVDQIPFSDIVEVRMPHQDGWDAYFRQLSIISPNGQSRVSRMATSDGIQVTSSAARTYITHRGSDQKIESWYHVAFPAWSLRPLWVRVDKVVERWQFAPTDVPLTMVQFDSPDSADLLSRGKRCRVDESIAGTKLESNALRFGWGVGTHAPCTLNIPLPSFAVAFETSVGLDRSAGNGGCAQAQIFRLGGGQEIAAGAPLWQSGQIVGSKQVQHTGWLQLPKIEQPTKLVLHADPQIKDRPKGADPLDIRDHLNWLHPVVRLEKTALLNHIRGFLHETIPGWRNWEVVFPNDKLLVEYVWDESDSSAPAFRLQLNLGGEPLRLRRKMQIEPHNQLLRTHILQLLDKGPSPGDIELKVTGITVTKLPLFPNAEDTPIVFSLAKWIGQEVELELMVHPRSPDDRIKWTELSQSQFGSQARWHPLRIESAKSKGGSKFEFLRDGSLLAVGRAPLQDHYQIRGTAAVDQISGVRLEMLPHATLPRRGPGRYGDGNFILSQFFISTPDDSKPTSLPKGQFLRIELPGTQKVLHMAEVEVFVGETNVALGGEATQATTAHEGWARLAIDGNTKGQFTDKSCSHTIPGQTDAWWQVDLKEEVEIDRIRVWNRTDYNVNRLICGFHVKILDAEHQVVWERGPIDYQPSPYLDITSTEPSYVAIRDAVASYEQPGFPIEKSLDLGVSGWAIQPRTGRAHTAVFALQNPLRGRGKTIEFGLLDRSGPRGLSPGRFRISVTSEQPPFAAEVPGLTAGEFPTGIPPYQDKSPSPLMLIDEEAKVISLIGPNHKAQWQANEPIRGAKCLVIPKGESVRIEFPNTIRIRHSPAESELRHMRIAWRKKGGGSFDLKFESPFSDGSEQDLVVGSRDGAISAERIWGSGIPETWVFADLDLWGYVGDRDLSSLAISVPDGESLSIDSIHAVRNTGDFEKVQPRAEILKVNQDARRALATPAIEATRPGLVRVDIDGRQLTGLLIGDTNHVVTVGFALVRPGREVTVHFNDGKQISGITAGISRDAGLGLVELVDPAPVNGLQLSADKRLLDHRLYVGFAMMATPLPDKIDFSYITAIDLRTPKRFASDYLPTNHLIGGPLVNGQNQVVGFNCANAENGKLQFSRVHSLLANWQQLVEGKMIGKWQIGHQPLLGVTTTDSENGVVVSRVAADSLAAKGGLKDNDVIVKIENIEVKNTGDIAPALIEHDPADAVSIEVKRGDATESLEVQLSSR